MAKVAKLFRIKWPNSVGISGQIVSEYPKNSIASGKRAFFNPFTGNSFILAKVKASIAKAGVNKSHPLHPMGDELERRLIYDG